MKDFWLSFIPVFVAIDVIGTLPMFLKFTEHASHAQRQKLIIQSTFTALIVATILIFSGRAIFDFLGITISDFKIAGGLILLIIAVKDLVSPGEDESKIPSDPSELGVVPLGIPLILGPAVITALLILVDTHGYLLTFSSLFVNLILVAVVFYSGQWLQKIMGKNGAGAFAKVSSLFLAAIAVMMIRKGIHELFA